MSTQAETTQAPESEEQQPQWIVSSTSTRTPRYIFLFLIGLAGVVVALIQLIPPQFSLTVQHLRIGDEPRIPVTVLTNTPENPGPAVVLAHGLAGSHQMMYAFATTLAHNGYTAITLDFPGHGRNVRPLRGSTESPEDRAARFAQLVTVMDQVVGFASDREQSDGRVALLGDAMGADVMLRYANENPDRVEAVVAVSTAAEDVTITDVPNLLVVTGALEFTLQDFARQVANTAADGTGAAGVTYGDFEASTARRVIFVPGVEHTGLLFSRTSMDETLNWLNSTFSLQPEDDTPYLDGRAPWLVLLYLSAIALFWPFSLLIQPVVRSTDATAEPDVPVRWVWFIVAALFPAVVTPVLLWLLPWLLPFDIDQLLPILAGGPLIIHFAFYGILTALGLLLYRIVTRRNMPRQPSSLRYPSVPIAMSLLIIGYVFLLFGVPTQLFLLNYFPPLDRLGITAIVFVALLPYFLADEALTRGPGVPPGAYVITKVLLIISLGVAIVLYPSMLFLFLMSPVFIGYFLIYGFINWRIYRRTRTALVGGLTTAVIFAWTIAGIFPLVT